jgi:hypothetical protein
MGFILARRNHERGKVATAMPHSLLTIAVMYREA